MTMTPKQHFTQIGTLDKKNGQKIIDIQSTHLMWNASIVLHAATNQIIELKKYTTT